MQGVVVEGGDRRSWSRACPCSPTLMEPEPLLLSSLPPSAQQHWSSGPAVSPGPLSVQLFSGENTSTGWSKGGESRGFPSPGIRTLDRSLNRFVPQFVQQGE